MTKGSNRFVTTYSDQSERIWRNIDNNEIVKSSTVLSYSGRYYSINIGPVNLAYFSKDNHYFDMVSYNNTYYLMGARNNRAFIDQYNEGDNTFKNLLYLTKSLDGYFIISDKARSLTVDSSGNMYAALTNTGKFGGQLTSSCVIIKSHLTSSTEWYAIASFTGASTQYNTIVGEVCKRIITDKNDNVFLFTYEDLVSQVNSDWLISLPFVQQSSSMFVRKSSDYGKSWTVVDKFNISR